MKTIKLLIIGLFYFTFIRSESKLEIYLNLNDCINCNIGLHSINKLDENIKIIFIIDKSSSPYFSELLKSNGIERIDNLNIIEKEVHEFYRSYCLLYQNSNKTDSFQLNDLFMMSKKINESSQIKVELKQKVKLNDSLIFSDRTSFNFHKNNFVAYDYLLNKVYYAKYDFNTEKVLYEKKISYSDFNRNLFLKFKEIDKGAYDDFYPSMVYIGKVNPHFENVYINDSILSILINFPCPVFNHKGDTLLGGKLFVYKKNVLHNKSSLFCLPDNELPSNTIENCFIDNTQPFFLRNQEIFFTLFLLKPISPKPTVASFTESNSRLELNDFKKFKISIKDSITGASSSFSSQNSEFYFMNNAPYLIEIKNLKESYITLLESVFKKGYYLKDVRSTNGIYNLLFWNKDEHRIITYNETSNKILSDRTLQINNADINFSSIHLNDYKEISCIDKKFKYVYIYTHD